MDPSILRDYYVIPLVKDLPICTPDGFFAKLQSNASSSTYYCSDREGNAIESFHGIAQDSTEGMESVTVRALDLKPLSSINRGLHSSIPNRRLFQTSIQD